MSRWAGYLVLAKFHLNLLVLAAVATGFMQGSAGPLDWARLWEVLAGVGLAGWGAAALNQYLERGLDARMRRTCQRPLPAGLVTPAEALRFALTCAAAGLSALWLCAGARTALLALAAFVLYAFVYTPLKTRTTLHTLVGAVAGALPPVLGWTAAAGRPGPGAWVLFTILFIWQLPHVLAAAWLAREDHARAGVRTLSLAGETSGELAARTCLLLSLALVPASLLPVLAGLAGWAYAALALPCGLALAGLAAHFASTRADAAARALFLATVIYLPVLFGLLIWARRA